MTEEEITQLKQNRNEAEKQSGLQKRLDAERIDTTFLADGDLEKKLNSFKKLDPIGCFKILNEGRNYIIHLADDRFTCICCGVTGYDWIKLCIALVRPRCAVFRLYRQSVLGKTSAGLQRALRGNLCSFLQDVKKAMTVAEVIPLPCKDLSDFFYVYLVGSNVPDHITRKNLPQLLHVRRAVIDQRRVSFQTSITLEWRHVFDQSERSQRLLHQKVQIVKTTCALDVDPSSVKVKIHPRTEVVDLSGQEDVAVHAKVIICWQCVK
ncbi:hypothetical protein MIR68_010636 [Amoeboaphelidium protococcarum]|nr:hypothetical protein MIR68_010636 [Amoeboaphelidium protococcarum]